MRYAGPPRCPKCGAVRVRPSGALPEPVADRTDGTLWVRFAATCEACGARLVRSARVRPPSEPWRLEPPPDRMAG